MGGSWYLPLGIMGIVFLLIDIIIAVVFCLYLIAKKKKEKKKNEDLEMERLLKIKSNPLQIPPTVSVDYSPDIFQIPQFSPSKDTSKRWNFDIDKYPKKRRERPLSNIPRLCFELSYNFRSVELNINLFSAKNLPNNWNEQVMISILMSHCSKIYHTSRVDGPNPIFDEDFQFPLESVQISSDPPVMLKFNIWTVDRYSRKHPFGYLESSIEDILTSNGLSPIKGKAQVWRNILMSESLTDESILGELFLSLAYLQGAQRISIILVKAKQLVLRSTDKDLQAIITLLHRGVVKKTVTSNFVSVATDPEFNEEFIFQLAEFDDVSIDRVTINVEITCRQTKRFIKNRVLGQVILGNSSSKRKGREHWTNMLTAQSSLTKWHALSTD